MPPQISLWRYMLGSGPGIADVRVACGLPPTKKKTPKPTTTSPTKETPSKETPTKSDEAKSNKKDEPAMKTDPSANKTNKHSFQPHEDAFMLNKIEKQGKTGPNFHSTMSKYGRTEEECRERYAELQASNTSNAVVETIKIKDNNNNAATADDKADKKANADKAKEPATEQITLVPDEDFSVQELEILADLYLKDLKDVWLRVASGFWDRTGRRLHPDDVRVKFGG